MDKEFCIQFSHIFAPDNWVDYGHTDFSGCTPKIFDTVEQARKDCVELGPMYAGHRWQKRIFDAETKEIVEYVHKFTKWTGLFTENMRSVPLWLVRQHTEIERKKQELRAFGLSDDDIAAIVKEAQDKAAHSVHSFSTWLDALWEDRKKELNQ